MAAGETLLAWNATANHPPASNFATFDTRNTHPVLDFDDTVDENAHFGGVLPRYYNGGGIIVQLVWLATTATTGSCRWAVAFERHQDEVTDLDVDDFAAAKTADATPAATNGAPQYTEISFSNSEIDGLLMSESFRLRVTRQGSNAADTMVGDAELLRVALREAP
jgi:hypothetical protein